MGWREALYAFLLHPLAPLRPYGWQMKLYALLVGVHELYALFLLPHMSYALLMGGRNALRHYAPLEKSFTPLKAFTPLEE